MKHVEIVINRTPCEHSKVGYNETGLWWRYHYCDLDETKLDESNVATEPCTARDFCSCPLNTKEMRLEILKKKAREV